MSPRDVLMACGLALSGIGILMAVLTVFREEGPAILLAWPRVFVLGQILVMGSRL